MEVSEDLVAAVKPWTEGWEGKRNQVYSDTRGNPTIGIGCDLRRPGIALVLGKLGIDYLALLNGSTGLSDEQIQIIFDQDVRTAIRGAVNIFGASWDGFPVQAQTAFSDMVFQMGPTGVAGFGDMIRAAFSGKWPAAADAMLDSKWARDDSPKRAQANAGLVRGCA